MSKKRLTGFAAVRYSEMERGYGTEPNLLCSIARPAALYGNAHMSHDEPTPESSQSIEDLAERLDPAGAEGPSGLIAGSLRFALRHPAPARRLLLTWEAEQTARGAFAGADQPSPIRRLVCLECGRLFRAVPYKGGWCEPACFVRWSADLPPEPRRGES